MDDAQRDPQTAGAHAPPPGALREVTLLFLRLGFTAFGGPASHIAIMHDEVVRRRQWISEQRFLDLLGLVNIIPGPSSTEMAIYLGYTRAGWWGLLLGGLCFIGPAMAIVMALAWGYRAYGSLPQLVAFFYGVKPVVIAIVTQALLGLGRSAIKGVWPLILAIGAMALYLAGVNVIILIFGGGALYAIMRWVEHWRREKTGLSAAFLPLSLAGLRQVGPGMLRLLLVPAAGAVPFGLLTLFLTFFKIGAVLYGSGYVLLAFLHSDFVLRLHWLTDQQLLDAVSVGQFTPGPVFTTATFIGYLLGGWQAGVLATVAIFLPAFVFVPLVHELAARLRALPWTARLLEGVNTIAVALMAGVLLQLAQSALVDTLTWAIAIASLGLALRLKVNSVWLILGGALVGLLRLALAG